MADADPEPILNELRAWATARALPEVEDEWDAGYEALRAKLLAWIQEQREAAAQDRT